MDEQPLHKAIVSAINEFCEVKDDVAKALRESITEVLDFCLDRFWLAYQLLNVSPTAVPFPLELG